MCLGGGWPGSPPGDPGPGGAATLPAGPPSLCPGPSWRRGGAVREWVPLAPTCRASGGTSGRCAAVFSPRPRAPPPGRNNCLHGDGARRGGRGAAAPPRRTEPRRSRAEPARPRGGRRHGGAWGPAGGGREERGCRRRSERGRRRRSGAPPLPPPPPPGTDLARCRPARPGSDAAMGSRFSSIPALPRGGQGRLHRARHHHLKGTGTPGIPGTPSIPSRTGTPGRTGTRGTLGHPRHPCSPEWDGCSGHPEAGWAPRQDTNPRDPKLGWDPQALIAP